MMQNWTKSFHDAVHEAHFRAAITGLRYRVRYDRANGWWDLWETVTRLEGR
jgi:hypothetical protein